MDANKNVRLTMTVTVDGESKASSVYADIDKEFANSANLMLMIEHMARASCRYVKQLHGIPVSLDEYREWVKRTEGAEIH